MVGLGLSAQTVNIGALVLRLKDTPTVPKDELDFFFFKVNCEVLHVSPNLRSPGPRNMTRLYYLFLKTSGFSVESR